MGASGPGPDPVRDRTAAVPPVARVSSLGRRAGAREGQGAGRPGREFAGRRRRKHRSVGRTSYQRNLCIWVLGTRTSTLDVAPPKPRSAPSAPATHASARPLSPARPRHSRAPPPPSPRFGPGLPARTGPRLNVPRKVPTGERTVNELCVGRW